MSTAAIVKFPAANPRSDQPGAGTDLVSKFKFVKVQDRRGHDIEGLWIRNGRFYYQVRMPESLGKGCRRIPLLDEDNQPVQTVEHARDAIAEWRRRKREGDLPRSGRAPHFQEFVAHYLSRVRATGEKSTKTITQETSSLKGWARYLGSIRINQVTRKHVSDYVHKRRQASGSRRQRAGSILSDSGVGTRTANLDVIILRSCLKLAQAENHLHGKLPTDGFKPLPYKAPKRPSFTTEQLDYLCEIALSKEAGGSPKFRNGQLLVDVMKFLRASGARITSGLATLWSDVDWSKRQVHLRKTKYDKRNVVVDFNNELEAHLKDMNARRLPDSDCLFPGTKTKGSVGSLRKTFEQVRKEAGLPNLHFHDLRHYFISHCVMSGVDFATVAKWVGHEDGGILICKVYSHLSNEHAQRAARKVSFRQGDDENPTDEGNSELSKEELLRLVRQMMKKHEIEPSARTKRQVASDERQATRNK